MPRISNPDTLKTIERLLANPIAEYPQATVAAFDPTTGDLPRRKLDKPLLKRMLSAYGELKIPAVLLAASTGGGHLRTVDELREWFSAASEANVGDMMLTVLLRPEDGLKACAAMLDQLAELGRVPVVFFRPGNNLPTNASDNTVAEQLIPFVSAAADRGFAIGLYSIPDVSGVALSPAATTQICHGPGGERVVAIKITEASYENSTAKFLACEALSGKKIVQGWDTHLARALRDGDMADRNRCGVTSGPMSFASLQYLHILKHANVKDWNEVALAQTAVNKVFASMQDDPMKFADLQRAKAIMGLGQPLSRELSEEQIGRVLTALQSVERPADQDRLARSLNLLGISPYAEKLQSLISAK